MRDSQPVSSIYKHITGWGACITSIPHFHARPHTTISANKHCHRVTTAAVPGACFFTVRIVKACPQNQVTLTKRRRPGPMYISQGTHANSTQTNPRATQLIYNVEPTYPGFLTSQSLRWTCEAGKIPLLCLSRREKPRYHPAFSSNI